MKRKITRRHIVRVRFILKEAAAKESLILLTIRINKKRVVWSTGEYIKPGPKKGKTYENWNTVTRRAVLSGRNVEAMDLNKRLQAYEYSAIDIYNEWGLSNPEKAARTKSDRFKLELDYRTGKRERPKAAGKLDTTDFVRYAESWRDKQRQKVGLSKNGFKSINTKVNNLRRFADANYGSDIPFTDVDDVMINQFKAYLFRERELAPQTVSRTLVTLQSIIKRAAKRGLLQFDDDLSESLKQDFRQTPKVVFYRDDIQKLIDLDLSDRPNLEHTRDLFLIGVLTGQRWGDFSRMTKENFKQMKDGRYRFEVHGQEKTPEAKAGGFILPWGRVILEKYGYVGNRPFIPYTLTPKQFRINIKAVAKMVFGDETFRTYKDGEVADLKGELVPKYQLVSTHTARRTCASLLLLMGMTLHDVAKHTGHGDPKQLVNYDHVQAEIRAMEAAPMMIRGWEESRLRAI